MTINKQAGLDRHQNPKQTVSSEMQEKLTEVLIPNLDKMRYMEMMSLFNSKPYDEGVVRTENHARIFLYFSELSQMSDEEIDAHLQDLQRDHPNLQGTVYLRKHQERKFISLEPLFPDS